MYGITTGNVHAYRENMRQLKRYTFIWPDFEQVDSIGSKATLYEHLDLIAWSTTKTARLKWERLTAGEPIKRSGVIKRSHSDSGQHVFIREKKDDATNWEYLAEKMKVPGCCWMWQAYSDPLKRLGEWRVIIVGGEIYCVVHTLHHPSKNIWGAEVVSHWYTLEELAYVYIFPSHSLLRGSRVP
jgi:hypothetical protein